MEETKIELLLEDFDIHNNVPVNGIAIHDKKYSFIVKNFVQPEDCPLSRALLRTHDMLVSIGGFGDIYINGKPRYITELPNGPSHQTQIYDAYETLCKGEKVFITLYSK